VVVTTVCSATGSCCWRTTVVSCGAPSGCALNTLAAVREKRNAFMGERRDALKHMACASQPGPEVSTPRDGAKAAERDLGFSPCKRTVVHGAYPGSHTQF
jgi:hypothetical protein